MLTKEFIQFFSKIGKKLPEETIRPVESIYQDDAFTRQMPGRRITLALHVTYMFRKD